MQQKRQPRRMCTGCGEMKNKRDLIRVVRSPEGTLSIDKRGKLPGRGAYLCPNADCLKKAVKTKRLERNLETPVPDEIMEQLKKEIEAVD